MQSRKTGRWTSDWCPQVQEAPAQRAMLGGSASARALVGKGFGKAWSDFFSRDLKEGH